MVHTEVETYDVMLESVVTCHSWYPSGGGASVKYRQIAFPSGIMHISFLKSVVKMSATPGSVTQNVVAAPSIPRFVLSNALNPSNLPFLTAAAAAGERATVFVSNDCGACSFKLKPKRDVFSATLEYSVPEVKSAWIVNALHMSFWL